MRICAQTRQAVRSKYISNWKPLLSLMLEKMGPAGVLEPYPESYQLHWKLSSQFIDFRSYLYLLMKTTALLWGPAAVSKHLKLEKETA